jgi:hypothetical protein
MNAPTELYDNMFVLAPETMTKEVMDSVLEGWNTQGYETYIKRCKNDIWLCAKRV